MDNCIIPIELIEIICKHDYTNWVALIRTCKIVCKCLMPLRWDVKSEILHTTMTTRYFFTNMIDVSIRYKNGVVCSKYLTICGDYWNVSGICDRAHSGAMIDESVSFASSQIDNIYFYKNNKCVGGYMSNKDYGKRYYEVINSPTELYDVKFYTKADLMAKLDELGIKYTWLKYVKVEN
ncbi:hypothetical protein E24_00002 [Faustovirus]|nr:hypothetical protein PRJ_Fausto_00002 [Faustovirus]AMN82938.1 hypothetical protein E24_00002 [Faustovirus]AMN83925.1 hypothetical protein D5a_00002 [Faustovirus]AMN84910.1 hypothetical protein E23_00002 [Faustovirus]QBR98896.1 hypothetical protein [Faustovirus mariensis]